MRKINEVVEEGIVLVIKSSWTIVEHEKTSSNNNFWNTERRFSQMVAGWDKGWLGTVMDRRVLATWIGVTHLLTDADQHQRVAKYMANEGNTWECWKKEEFQQEGKT